MTQEVLKLALEALEEAWYHVGTFQPTEKAIDLYDEARAAIKEALREHAMREVQRLGQEIEQEPVVGIAAIRTWFKDGRVVTQTLCNSWVDTTPPQRTHALMQNIRNYLVAAADGNMSRNNSEQLASELLQEIDAHDIKENT